MKLKLIFILFLAFVTNIVNAQINLDYGIADKPWEEGLGNHRAILQVSQTGDAVHLNMFWRRHDKTPQKRKLIIINAKTGEKVKNIKRLEVNNEKCELLFGPVKETGLYYFYYLPFKPDAQYGAYSYGYRRKEGMPNIFWSLRNSSRKAKQLPQAICTEVQARKKFDSFYPMEVTALKTEVTELIGKEKTDYIAIAEDRAYPIKMRDYIPQRWITNGITNKFEGQVQRNEYYSFQIGIFAHKKDLKNVRLEFNELKTSNGEKIFASAFTCFNTTGVDPYGKPFTKQVNVNKNRIQALWIGTDIPENIIPGEYVGDVVIKIDGQPDKTIQIKLNISNEIIADRGDSEPWKHSRLRWLNSTIGLDDNPVAPYSTISTSTNKLKLTGKEISFDKNGLPASINVWGTEVLARPIEYILNGEKPQNYNKENQDIKSGKVTDNYSSSSQNFDIKTIAVTEFDGTLNYKIKLTAKSKITLKDFRINIPFKSSVAEYMMGMNLDGTTVPNSHSAKWRGPHDSFWVGNTYGGLHVELRGTTYSGPLLNLYNPDHPASWDNNGKGGFSIKKNGGETVASIYSGKRKFSKGEEVVFEFQLLITPVKKINTKDQFTSRYYHDGRNPIPKDNEITDGVKIINVHHANKYNPYINYPFIATKEMKSLVDQMHEKDLKVKIYYTIRELTDRVTEIWALRSLDNEILGTGKGGGYPWLQEHFVSDYDPQWYSPLDGDIDASILTAPGESRWFNYYLEGLKWLIADVGIDGLYLDDVSYDRRILKRMRKIMDNTKPGCILDLHSNTNFSKGPVTQYAEFFPYINKLWFGESFKYDKMPADNWLVEVSGIPFGLMGDMLHAGGNPWRGMIYGMTVRYPWFTDGVTCDPRQIWKVWDSFGIADAKMIGYWDKNPVVSTTNKNVLATAYVKDGKLLVSIASWALTSTNVKLNIDWEAVGLDKSKVKITAPKIDQFQEQQTFSINEEITVKPKKGWLLVIE